MTHPSIDFVAIPAFSMEEVSADKPDYPFVCHETVQADGACAVALICVRSTAAASALAFSLTSLISLCSSSESFMYCCHEVMICSVITRTGVIVMAPIGLVQCSL